MTKPTDFDVNPWPDSRPNRLIFILDADNRFERELLTQWLSHHGDSQGAYITVITVSLDDEGKNLSTRELEQVLDNDTDGLVTPLRIAWLPESTFSEYKPRLRDLVAGNPRRPTSRRGKAILQKNPERVFCLKGAPATLGDMRGRFQRRSKLNAGRRNAEFAEFIAHQAGLALDIAERRLIGGRYKVPRYITQSILSNPSYKNALKEVAQKDGKSMPLVLKEAHGYMKEMISFPRRFYIDLFAAMNNFVLGLGYENQVVIDKQEIQALRNIVRENPSVLLWTHKTYLDGMVVPKVLYENDFPLPHIFGGANLSFAGLSFLIRRSGGIFIRRSFQENLLYKATLKHYISYLMDKRFPMNWSFEGTRSRLGKLMPPRYGLLKYVLEACHNSHAQNIHIVPVAINYDLIRDVEEYAVEQTGRIKQPESLRWFIGYVRSLAKPMGRVYMDIGKPVVLDKAPDPEDKLALSKIAFEVAVEANRVTRLTLPSLVTMSLLGSAPVALTQEELTEHVLDLYQWAVRRDLRMSDDFDPENQEHMRSILNLMIKERILTRYDQGPDIVFGIGVEQHPVASYYRNTVIHFFVNKAIIEMAVMKAAEATEGDTLETFWREVDHLRDLFKFEFFYAPTDKFHEEIKRELELASPDWEGRIKRGGGEFVLLLDELAPLVAHATLLTYAEAYSVVANMLAQLEPDQALDEKSCANQAIRYGRQAFMQRRISSEASIGKILFQNAYQLLRHQGLTDAGGEQLGEQRKLVARELRELAVRLDRVKGIVTARRGSPLDIS